jgi:hypothetical protein
MSITELIEAFTIFKKYDDVSYPTSCDHDVLYVCGISPSIVSEEDIARLDELGFIASHDDDNFYSYRYGSC